MAKQDRIYAIVGKNGNLIHESSRVPLFWTRAIAQERAEELNCKMVKLSLDKLNKFINDPENSK